MLVPHLGSLTGGHTTPDITGRPLKGVLFDLSHLGVSCQVTILTLQRLAKLLAADVGGGHPSRCCFVFVRLLLSLLFQQATNWNNGCPNSWPFLPFLSLLLLHHRVDS